MPKPTRADADQFCTDLVTSFRAVITEWAGKGVISVSEVAEEVFARMDRPEESRQLITLFCEHSCEELWGIEAHARRIAAGEEPPIEEQWAEVERRRGKR